MTALSPGFYWYRGRIFNGGVHCVHRESPEWTPVEIIEVDGHGHHLTMLLNEVTIRPEDVRLMQQYGEFVELKPPP